MTFGCTDWFILEAVCKSTFLGWKLYLVRREVDLGTAEYDWD